MLFRSPQNPKPPAVVESINYCDVAINMSNLNEYLLDTDTSKNDALPVNYSKQIDLTLSQNNTGEEETPLSPSRVHDDLRPSFHS